MQGVSSGPPAYPDPEHVEALNWDDLVAGGIAGHLKVTNRELDAAFAGTIFAHDDPEAAADPAAIDPIEYQHAYGAALGARVIEHHTHFRLCAPRARSVELCVSDDEGATWRAAAGTPVPVYPLRPGGAPFDGLLR